MYHAVMPDPQEAMVQLTHWALVYMRPWHGYKLGQGDGG